MRRTLLALLVLGAVLAGVSPPGGATIEIAKKEKQKCTTCHVKMGSKELNAAGRYYAQHRTLEGYPPKPAPPAKPAPPPQPAPPAEPEEPPAPEAPAMELPRRLLIYRFEVEPAKFLQFEEALHNLVEAAQAVELGEDFAWEVSQSGPFTYWLFQEVKDFHQLDATTEYAQELHRRYDTAMGTERIRELQAAAWPAIRTLESWVVESVPGLAYQPPNFEPLQPPRYAHIDIERVRPERAGDYEKLLERLGGILQQAGYPYPMRVYHTLTGPLNTYYIIFPVANRGELFEHYRYADELIPQSVGTEEWQALIEEWAGTLAEFDHYDELMRPDLSYQPGSTEQSAGGPEEE